MEKTQMKDKIKIGVFGDNYNVRGLHNKVPTELNEFASIQFNGRNIEGDIFWWCHQSDYSAMRDEYIRNCDVVLLPFFIVDSNPFESMKDWCERISRVQNRDSQEIPVVVIGMNVTKRDVSMFEESARDFMASESNDRPTVSYDQGLAKVWEIGAADYVEFFPESEGAVVNVETLIKIAAKAFQALEFFSKMKANDLKWIEQWINSNKDNVDCENCLRQTPLHIAARGNYEAAAKLLLKAGADLNVKDKDGNTPLHLAAKNHAGNTFSLLLKSGAAIGIINASSQTVVDFAPQWVMELLQKDSHIQFQILKQHYTQQLEQVLKAIEAGGQLLDCSNIVLFEEQLPGILAQVEKRTWVIDYQLLGLIGKQSGFAAIHRQIAKNAQEDALAAANRNQTKDVLRLTQPSSILYKEFGYTALHIAAMVGKTDLISSLVQQHCEVEAGDKQGRTARQLALLHQHGEFAERLALLEKERNFNRLLKQNETAEQKNITFKEEQGALLQELKDLSQEDDFLQAVRELRLCPQPAAFPELHQFLTQPLFPQCWVKQMPDSKPSGSRLNLVKNKLTSSGELGDVLSRLNQLQKWRKEAVKTTLEEAVKTTLTNSLLVIVKYYKNYIKKFKTAAEAEKPQLLQIPGILQVAGWEPRLLKKETMPMLVTAPSQDKALSDAPSGQHVVKQRGGIHFKKDPHAPGVEFMVGTLSNLLIARGATPTELVKVIEGGGFQHTYLASRTVQGVDLQHILERNPSYLTKIDPKNFSAMMVLSLLINPQDGKPDNYMVEFKRNQGNDILEIIGIDNDIAFAESKIYQHSHGEFKNQTFVMVKNVLYFFPQMTQPVDENFRDLFLQQNPEFLIIEWLKALYDKNLHYQKLLSEGIFTPEEFYGGKISKRGLQLPIRLVPGTVTQLYHKLCQLQVCLRAHPQVTHAELFQKIEPTLSDYYQKIAKQHPDNVMGCLRQLYLNALSHQSQRQQLETRMTSSNTAAMTKSVLASIEQWDFESQRTQSIAEAALEFILIVPYDCFDDLTLPLLQQSLQTLAFIKLELAIDYEDPKILLQQGAASKTETTALLNYLLNNKGLPLYTRYPGGESLLHIAAQRGLNSWVSFLLAKGLSVNLVNDAGYTPLHVAASRGDIPMIECLVYAKANLNSKEKHQETPLDKALKREKLEAAHWLWQQGARECQSCYQETLQKWAARADVASNATLVATQGIFNSWVQPKRSLPSSLHTQEYPVEGLNEI
jgi:ankyrin repeat protein